MSIWSSVSDENEKYDVARSGLAPRVRLTVYGVDGGFDEATAELYPHEAIALVRALAEALQLAVEVWIEEAS